MKLENASSIFFVTPIMSQALNGTNHTFGTYEVEGSGQETVKAIRKICPKSIIILKGFKLNGNYIPLRK